jgi:hypothetical protein
MVKMFLEINYEKVKHYPANHIPQHDIKVYSRENSGDIDVSFIENIISNNLNIQIALADQYFFEREFDAKVVSSITISDNKSVEDEINKLTTIFMRVVVPFDQNGSPYIIQLNGINKFVKDIFKDMILNDKINPILKFFTLEKSFLCDCNRTAFYEYIDSDKIKDDEQDYNCFKNDEYVKYILSDRKRFTSASFINVSGFSIEELNKSVYIKYLKSLVRNLYLFIFDCSIDDKPYYIKQLRWY